MIKTSLIAAAAASMVMAGSAWAQTTYTNRTAFEAAAGSTQTETFNTAATRRFSPVYSVAFNGFTISGTTNGNNVGVGTGSFADGGEAYAIPASFTGQNYLGWGDGEPGGTIGTITFSFAAPIMSFGFNWFNTDVTDQYQVNLPDGQVFTAPPFTVASNGASSGFFGIVSPTALSSFTISNNRFAGYISTEGLDNLTFSTPAIAAAVPEPATWALMILGFGVVGVGLRRAARRSDQKFDLRIRRITEGALA